MRTLTLHRYESSEQGTLGVLYFEDFYVFTLELPWANNASNISCIPAGEYDVDRRFSPSFGKETYRIKNVPGRSYILIHAANFAGSVADGWQSHLQGCIALGGDTGYAPNKYGKKQRCIFESAAAVGRFEDFMAKAPFKLIIKDVEHG